MKKKFKLFDKSKLVLMLILVCFSVITGCADEELKTQSSKCNIEESSILNIRKVTLKKVSNASGLGLKIVNGKPVIITIDDIRRKENKENRPSFTYSNPANGKVIRTENFPTGNLEGVTYKDGKLAILHGDEDIDNKYFITWNNRKVQLDLSKVQPILAKNVGVTLEGLTSDKNGWNTLASFFNFKQGIQYEMYIIQFDVNGKQTGIIGPLNQNGKKLSDHGGALAKYKDTFLIGSFHKKNISLVDKDGNIKRQIKSPDQRIEGMAFDPDKCQLYLVRECVGIGSDCPGEEPEDAQGKEVPMYIITFEKE